MPHVVSVFTSPLAQAEILRIEEHPAVRVRLQVIVAELQATSDVGVTEARLLAVPSPGQWLSSLLENTLNSAEASWLQASPLTQVRDGAACSACSRPFARLAPLLGRQDALPSLAPLVPVVRMCTSANRQPKVDCVSAASIFPCELRYVRVLPSQAANLFPLFNSQL